MNSNIVNPGQKYTLPKTLTQLEVGLGWSSTQTGIDVDLDASIIMFDFSGKISDVVYYGKLQSNDGSVIHQGDAVIGDGEGDDEPLMTVETAEARLKDRQTNNIITEISLGMQGDNTALIMIKIYRDIESDGNQWVVHCIGQGAKGRTFADILPQAQNCLRDVMPDIIIDPTPPFPILRKGEIMHLSPTASKFFVGLGWDVAKGHGDIDLDANCILYNIQGNVEEAIFYRNLTSMNRAVVHSGDNLTGEGDGGWDVAKGHGDIDLDANCILYNIQDDEILFVDLSRMKNNVNCLLFTVTSYSGEHFGFVRNAFVRLVDLSTNTVVAHYNISDNPSNSHYTGFIMCAIYRNKQGNWAVNAVGKGGTAKWYKDLLPQCNQEYQILKQKGVLMERDSPPKFQTDNGTWPPRTLHPPPLPNQKSTNQEVGCCLII
ncbi:camp-binding protein [Anaeramoeba ignava]|uniref:Camp-binding protein n=1 Tax=Anaeramoeba ignava TaxID=1746090 RepID=A0A9Q0RFG0_ANAIG|nr:camp-binding protein [Anaeramoeba ignava]